MEATHNTQQNVNTTDTKLTKVSPHKNKLPIISCLYNFMKIQTETKSTWTSQKT